MTKIAVYQVVDQSNFTPTISKEFQQLNDLGIPNLIVAFSHFPLSSTIEPPSLNNMLSSVSRPAYVFFAENPNKAGEVFPVFTFFGHQTQQTLIAKINELSARPFNQLVDIGNNGQIDNPIDLSGSNTLQPGLLGFGLFNINLPSWLWLIKTGYCGYQTLKNSDNNTKYLWGAGTVISATNYYNKIK